MARESLNKMLKDEFKPPKRGTLQRVYRDAYQHAMRGAPPPVTEQKARTLFDAVDAAWALDNYLQIRITQKALDDAYGPRDRMRKAATDKAWAAVVRAAKKREGKT